MGSVMNDESVGVCSRTWWAVASCVAAIERLWLKRSFLFNMLEVPSLFSVARDTYAHTQVYLPRSESFTTAIVVCSTGSMGGGGQVELNLQSILWSLQCLSLGLLEGGSEYWPRAVVYDFYCDPNGDILKPASVIEYPEYTYKGVTIPSVHCCCSA